MLSAKRYLQDHKMEEYKNKLEHNWRSSKPDLTISYELKPCFAFLINPFIVNAVTGGYPVRQPFVTNLSAVETKLTGSKKTLVNATLPLISGHRFQKIPTI